MKSRRSHSSWRDATTLDDLSAGVVAWLTGSVRRTPTYLGRPEPETALIRDRLITINQVAGVLTDSSQPGLLGEWRTRRGHVHRWSQRAYLAGYADATAVGDLTLGLYLAREAGELLLFTRPPHQGPYAGTDYGNEPVPVTADADGTPHTWVGHWAPARDITAFWGRGAPALLGAWQFAVVDPEWGRPDLLWDRVSAALGNPT